MADPVRDPLRLLAVFHGVLAGLTVLCSAFPLLYVGLGVWFLRGGPGGAAGAHPPPEFVGWFMLVLGLGFFVAVLAFAVMLGLAARFLSRARHWTYCLVVAALSCAFFPFGTALGVFTIVVLAKPEVRAAFEGQGNPG